MLGRRVLDDRDIGIVLLGLHRRAVQRELHSGRQRSAGQGYLGTGAGHRRAGLSDGPAAPKATRTARAGQFSPLSDGDQRHCRILRRPRLFRQVLRAIEDKVQRDILILGPVKRPVKARHLPRGDLGQISFPCAQRVGWRSPPVQIGQRRLIGGGQFSISGKGEVLRCNGR